MSGDKLVVSYEAIQSAQRVWSGAAASLTSVFGSVAPVGSDELYAKALDAALDAYASLLKQVGTELETQATGLAHYLSASEQVYRYVDATALTRAVPYDPHHPSPTMVVTRSHSAGSFTGSGAPTAPGEDTQGLNGTTSAGVPSGAHGTGSAHHVSPGTAAARGKDVPPLELSVFGDDQGLVTGQPPGLTVFDELGGTP